MRKILLVIFSGLFFSSYSIGQNNQKMLYQAAFEEQLQMLKGIRPINFKRAVFVTENAYYKGRLGYQTYCDSISAIGKQLKGFIKQRGLDKFKTSGNWAVFTYMTDSLPINNFKPYTYDFEDFMGDKDFSKMFVTKLMKTKSGNCHSLPTLYKILCEEIGAKAFLALAPNHLYIKHIDEGGQWTNLELTNGGFPRDQWIIKEMAISVEAIKSGVYMTPLTQKESIALAMTDLVTAYKSQYEYDDFVIKVVNTALSYFPKSIPLLMTKANYYKHIGVKENNKPQPDKALSIKNYNLYKETIKKIDALGYKDMPLDLYEQWVQSIEKEKIKRGISNISNNTPPKNLQ